MAQFTVNAQRFDPYKNFKFRVKWDGRYVAGVSKVGALKRTTEVVKHRDGGDPSSSRKSPGRTEYEAITLERGVTHDTEFEQWANKVWNYGSGLGAEVSLKDFRKDVIVEVYNEAGQLAIAYKVYPLLGVGVPGAARPRRQRQRRRDPAPQARERGLGTRLRGGRADRADVRRARGLADSGDPVAHMAQDRGSMPEDAAILDVWERSSALERPWRELALLELSGDGAVEAAARLPLGERDRRLLALRTSLFGRWIACEDTVQRLRRTSRAGAGQRGTRRTSHGVSSDGHTPDGGAAIRPPDSTDIAAALGADDPAAVILERCMDPRPASMS